MSSHDDWMRDDRPKSSLDAFKPEGSVAVPLLYCDVKLDGEKKLAFVDTLAMQTKLGVVNKVGEHSMSMRDSEIVQQRPISSSPSPFISGGTAKLVGVKMPSVLDLVGSTYGVKDEPRFAGLQSPPPPGYVAASEPRNIMPTPAGVVAAKQRLADIQAKIALPPVPATAPAPAPVPVLVEVVELPVVEKTPVVVPVVAPKHEPIVVESKPFVDQTEHIRELETENGVLMNIVARLVAENKALKAKK